MTKSEIVEILSKKQNNLNHQDLEASVKMLLNLMSSRLSDGGRIEVRGFGSFSLHYRKARRGRNPKTGEQVALRSKYVPHFKPGKELRERANESRAKVTIQC
jgi:integration host factor subunit beta